MIYSYLATAIALFGATYGAENVHTGSGSRCDNYIRRSGSELYPVNECYQVNTDKNEVCDAPTCPDTQNYMFQCKPADNGTEACLVRMGAGCSGVVLEENICYPCNGVEDACECTVSNEKPTNCQYYEETKYGGGLSLTNGWYCNKKSYILERKVVNMCIQGADGSGDSTVGYSCGGYDSRSNRVQDYAFDWNYYGTDDCSTSANSPTQAPTGSTNAPSMAPTAIDESGGLPWCTESVCDGVDSPRADGVDRKSVVVAIAFALLASSLMA